MVPRQRLLQYARPYRARIVRATTFSALNKLFDIMPEVLIGVAVDIVVNRSESFVARLGVPNLMHQLLLLGVLTLLIWGFESLFQYLYSIEWRTLAQTLQHDLRLETYAHVQELELSFFEDKSSGGLMAILNDDINQLERFLDTGANTFIQLATSTIVIGFIFFYLAPQIALVALLPVPIILWSAYAFQERLGPRYLLVRERAGELASRLSNALSGIVTIKAFTAEKYEVDALKTDSLAYQDANAKAIALSAAFIPVVRMAIVMGFVATIVWGGWLSVEGQLAVGAYSVLVFLTQRLLWPFTELAQMTDLYERAMASASRVLDLLETPIHMVRGDKTLNPATVKGHIEVKDVSFVYANGTKVFDGLSFDVPAGKTIAIVGSTGSGKSTLMKLLLRFYEATNGRVLLDGQDIKTIRLQDLRRAIGFVSQDVFMFQGTVRDNIAYGTFDATREQVVAAAKVAEAHEFIAAMPQGYDTVVGERGQKLSGGQRQRLSIARALLKHPHIFVLDEATSALDNETEAAIQRSIDRIVVGRTTIVIAHRLSTIRHAHNIIVMEQGKIVESGTHDVLVTKGGVYAGLWKIQTGE